MSELFPSVAEPALYYRDLGRTHEDVWLASFPFVVSPLGEVSYAMARDILPRVHEMVDTSYVFDFESFEITSEKLSKVYSLRDLWMKDYRSQNRALWMARAMGWLLPPAAMGVGVWAGFEPPMAVASALALGPGCVLELLLRTSGLREEALRPKNMVEKVIPSFVKGLMIAELNRNLRGFLRESAPLRLVYVPNFLRPYAEKMLMKNRYVR